MSDCDANQRAPSIREQSMYSRIAVVLIDCQRRGHAGNALQALHTQELKASWARRQGADESQRAENGELHGCEKSARGWNVEGSKFELWEKLNEEMAFVPIRRQTWTDATDAMSISPIKSILFFQLRTSLGSSTERQCSSPTDNQQSAFLIRKMTLPWKIQVVTFKELV